MKEFANSLAQLAAIIMILITLAVSTAAISQWANSSGSAASSSTAEGRDSQPQTLVASGAR
jgi:hypothetical protein